MAVLPNAAAACLKLQACPESSTTASLQPLQSMALLQVEALPAVQCFAVKTACNLQYMADVCPRRCLGRPGTCPRRRGTTWGQKKTSTLPCPSSNITFYQGLSMCNRLFVFTPYYLLVFGLQICSFYFEPKHFY